MYGAAARVAAELERLTRRGGPGRASPPQTRLVGAVHVQVRARGVYDVGDMVPLVIVVAGTGVRAPATVVDVVGRASQEPGTDRAAVQKHVIAVERPRHVLVDDASNPGRAARFDP